MAVLNLAMPQRITWWLEAELAQGRQKEPRHLSGQEQLAELQLPVWPGLEKQTQMLVLEPELSAGPALQVARLEP
jgi:hypothetical protein